MSAGAHAQNQRAMAAYRRALQAKQTLLEAGVAEGLFEPQWPQFKGRCRLARQLFKKTDATPESPLWHELRANVEKQCKVPRLHQARMDPDKWAARVQKEEPHCQVCGRPAYKVGGEVHPVRYHDGHWVHAECEADLDPSARYMNLKVSDSLEDEMASAALRSDGPLLDIALHPVGEDGTSLPPIYGKALVDTGADRTAVEVSELGGAKPTSHYWAQGVTSEGIKLPMYPMKLTFPGTTLGSVSVDRVAGTPHLKSQGLIALLGRDVLEQGRLTYDGPTGRFSFKLPKGHTEVQAPSATAGLVALSVVLGSVAALLWLTD